LVCDCYCMLERLSLPCLLKILGSSHVLCISCRINRVLLSDLLVTVGVTENAKSLFLRFIFTCWVSDPKQCFFLIWYPIRNWSVIVTFPSCLLKILDKHVLCVVSRRINWVLLSDLLETVVVTENAKSLLFLRFIFDHPMFCAFPAG
jgi:hypothetical protein